METFLLVLTLCGSLHTGGFACEDFILDYDQVKSDCIASVEAINQGKAKKLQSLINDASNDWFKRVESSKLNCTQEDKE